MSDSIRLMNERNIQEMEENGYRYIIGAKIKNESKDIGSGYRSRRRWLKQHT